MSNQLFVTESTRKYFHNYKVDFAFTLSVRQTCFFALDDLSPMTHGNNAVNSLATHKPPIPLTTRTLNYHTAIQRLSACSHRLLQRKTIFCFYFIVEVGFYNSFSERKTKFGINENKAGSF